ncbi:MAG: nucleoside hydrolase [Ruminococcaceae bacterium]|nr:nucleoside hydrolase [Oscillospiraceae bacterium]
MNNSMLEKMAQQLLRLKHPEGMVDVILDTDLGCEVDDQFALVYLVCAQEKLRIRGIHTAPFEGAVKGFQDPETSYIEIEKILRMLGRSDLMSLVRRGSGRYIPSETEPEESEAVRALIDISKEYTTENPLYVVAIGAISNVASALLLDPTLKDRICILWLGTAGMEMETAMEYNFSQDNAAARVVFASGAPLILFPCKGVTSHLQVTEPEIAYWLKGKNELCQYFYDNICSYMAVRTDNPCWNKVIWDIVTIAWLLNESWVQDRVITTPVPQYDHRLTRVSDGLPMRYVYYVDRDPIFQDLFRRMHDLETFASRKD